MVVRIMLSILQNRLPIKVSEQYLIRHIDNDDSEGVFQLYGNEKITKYVAKKVHSSIEESEEFIRIINERMKKGNDIYLGICEGTSQKLIGIIRFLEKEDSSTLTIGYALNEEYWGQGIVAAAVNKLIELIKLEGTYSRVRATVKPENINSQNCIEKLGFELVGRFNKTETVNSKEIETERLLYFKAL